MPTPVNIAITVPLYLSQFIARYALRRRHGRIAYVVRGAADVLLGLSPIVLGQVLLGEGLLLAFDWPSGSVALTILAITAAVGLWGAAVAWRPKVVVTPLTSERLSRPVRFVQISDVHIGSRTSRFLRQVIGAVNELDPEFLCITGDFIDRSGIGLDKLGSLTEFRGPIYFSTGNHEHYEDLEDIVGRLQALGVEVLRNRAIEVDGLQLIGIDDSPDPDQVANVLAGIDVRDDHYTILLYHRPHGLEAASRHGVDLKLSGHTHNGQIVPFHLMVRRAFRYTRGLYRFGGTYLYVNEGSGTWGPALRIGTRSEITLFEVSPAG